LVKTFYRTVSPSNVAFVLIFPC